MENNDQFKSSFGVLVALAGSAVGLGNLWRFPYLVGTNGGAAFIIVYLLFVVFLCLPIMYSEILLGRSKVNDIKLIKNTSLLSALVLMSFYSVVGGWSIGYLLKSVTFDVVSNSSEHLEQVYTNTISGLWYPLINTILFIVVTAGILVFGISKGVERFSKLMMPVLFLMVIIIAIRSLTLPGAMEGVEFLFRPDFSKITIDTLIAALGQAFFSLSIGCGCLFVYGKYISRDENVVKMSTLAAFSDAAFAIIAGLAIMPAVFSFGISPSEGPGLVFVTLPHIFSQMAGGEILAICFFITLFVAAVTSSISLLEVPVTYLMERFKMTRVVSLMLSVSVVLIFAVLATLSFSVLNDVKLFGFTIFDIFEKSSANILLPVGGLFIVLYMGWKMKREDYEREITNEGRLGMKRIVVSSIYYIVKFVAPIVVTIILLAGLFA